MARAITASPVLEVGSQRLKPQVEPQHCQGMLTSFRVIAKDFSLLAKVSAGAFHPAVLCANDVEIMVRLGQAANCKFLRVIQMRSNRVLKCLRSPMAKLSEVPLEGFGTNKSGFAALNHYKDDSGPDFQPFNSLN